MFLCTFILGYMLYLCTSNDYARLQKQVYILKCILLNTIKGYIFYIFIDWFTSIAIVDRPFALIQNELSSLSLILVTVTHQNTILISSTFKVGKNNNYPPFPPKWSFQNSQTCHWRKYSKNRRYNYAHNTS